MPAGINGTVISEVELFAVHRDQAGLHTAVTSVIIPLAVGMAPAGPHDTVIVKKVIFSVHGLLAGALVAFAVHPIGIPVDGEPAGLHGTFFIQIVFLSVYGLPAGTPAALLIHIIFFAFKGLPAGLHFTLVGKIINISFDFCPANRCFPGTGLEIHLLLCRFISDPAGLHHARLHVKIVPGSFNILKPCHHSALFICVRIIIAVLDPGLFCRKTVLQEIAVGHPGKFDPAGIAEKSDQKNCCDPGSDYNDPALLSGGCFIFFHSIHTQSSASSYPFCVAYSVSTPLSV